MLDNPSIIPLDKQINIPYTLYTMNKQALTELIADLRPNQIMKLGHFPDKELAKQIKAEIEKDIKNMKKDGIIVEDFAIIIKREPAGLVLLIYPLATLKAEIFSLEGEEFLKQKEVEL